MTGPDKLVSTSLAGTSRGDQLFKGVLTLAALFVPALLVALFIELFHGAGLSMSTFGLGFLVDSTWDPVAGEFGAFPLIFGTLLTSFIALLLAVPLSLGVAI